MQIDPVPARSATVLGIVYMETERLKKAERVLSGHISKHGDDGVVLTNLAKVYSRQMKPNLSERTLWRGLQADPNQDNGVGWYEALHRERSGDQAGITALQRVAKVPGSWRAQLWLARKELGAGRLNEALGFYKGSLANAGQPVPADLLMQMSGDLGNNLIKAFFDSGQLEAGRRILNQLFALKRPDWQETFSYWDTELAKARVTRQPVENEKKMEMTLLDIQGPLWLRDGSPFSSLSPAKGAGSGVIGILGSTVVYKAEAERLQSQLADAPGRLSRALPLLLTEWLHLHTTADAHGFIPWVQENGFAVFGKPYEDADLCVMAASQAVPVDYIVGGRR